MSGVNWGVTLNSLRKAQKALRAGDTVEADVLLQQQIEHISDVLNENMRTKRERIRKKKLDALLAKIARRDGDTGSV